MNKKKHHCMLKRDPASWKAMILNDEVSANSIMKRVTKHSDAQLSDDRTIPLDVHLHQVVEQVTALANHLQQATTGVVVLLVGTQMIGQIVDALGQNGDLHLGGAGVAFMHSVFLNNCGLFFFQHGKFHLFCGKAAINYPHSQKKAGELPVRGFTLHPGKGLQL